MRSGHLAVADGHGSATSFRSRLGADFAVAAAHEVSEGYLSAFASQPDDYSSTTTTEVDISRALVRAWRNAVERHIADEPFSEAELGTAEALQPGSRKRLDRNPFLAYGSTLLSVIVTTEFAIYQQLGDGDILTVSDDGAVYRPLPPDSRLLANETTSLCGPEAWRDFRVRVQPLTVQSPALIILSTDGYANSFNDDGGFLQVGRDLLGVIRTDGIADLQTKLENWLAETSEAGSGDDITIGLICRHDVVKPLPIRMTKISSPSRRFSIRRQTHLRKVRTKIRRVST